MIYFSAVERVPKDPELPSFEFWRAGALTFSCIKTMTPNSAVPTIEFRIKLLGYCYMSY